MSRVCTVLRSNLYGDRPDTPSLGDIFFGKNFGCLDSGKAPTILHDLDQVFPAYWVEWQFPLLHRLLLHVPYKALHQFLTAGHRFYGV